MVDDAIWQICVYGLCVGVVIAVMLGLPPLLGERHWKKPERRFDSATAIPYECGIQPTGSAQVRPPVQYYLIAMFFVIFDVETIFIFSWAIAFRDLGWYGFAGVLVFIILLVVVLIYEWRVGALDFGPDGKKILRAYKKITGQIK